MESKKNEKARGSLVTKVTLMTTILFVCLIVNVIASVAIQYTQIRDNVEQMLTENLSSSSVLVSNGMKNLNILVNDHSYDYQFIAGSAEDKKSHADMVASFDERVFGLTYIAADGKQYGEGVDESIKSSVFSAGKLLTTPTGEDGDFYYGLKNDMGALVSHMKAEKLATFLEGSTCDAFILSKDGTVIAAEVHTGAYEKAYPDYVQSAGQTYVNPSTGGNFMNGYCYAAASIDNTDGWTVLIRAQAGQFYSGIVSAFWVNIVLVVVMSGLGAMTVILMKRSIITPIKTIRKKIVDMSMGNISGGTVDITSNDELGDLAEAVNRMTNTNREMIVDIQYTAEQIAACNLAVQPRAEYNGDFIPIKNALESIIESLNDVVANV
ncbi:MAG: HAMP domain-containing protein, partial [Oscillospiraceae bacterium]